ncbi:IMP cyclohydrolase [Helicobacter felis]|uniref:IMP cyclohydrolase n=1 Tax=Helicobacter felis TaxID=214 RepID=UPI000CF04A64|nr:IMP cyclohydrolase [Helicobacter felis]
MRLLSETLQNQRYFGRGIIVGRAPKSPHVFLAYFLMGRSAQSQNRFFSLEGKNLQIVFVDPQSVADPSLIFYPPIVHQNNHIIITNGSQTQILQQSLLSGQDFQHALNQQSFEPDSPHFTPRISALVHLQPQNFSYQLGLVKNIQGTCARFLFNYESVGGVGHFLHTYNHDTNPLPSFEGEPKPILLPSTLEELGETLWEGLDLEYKIALCVQSVHLDTQQVKTHIYNKYSKDC